MIRPKHTLVPLAGLLLLAGAFFGGRALRSDAAPRRVATASTLSRRSYAEAPAGLADFVYSRENFLDLLKRDPVAARKLAAALFPRDEEFLVDYVDDVAVLRAARHRDLAVARLSKIVSDESADALYDFLLEGEKTAASALAEHMTRGAAARLIAAWDKLFKAARPLDTYAVLEALARMPDAKEMILGALRAATDPSRRNVLMSLAPRIDKAWALDLALEVLRSEAMRQVRDQAIVMLGMIGTAESKAQLLALLESADYAEAANVLLALDGLHLDAARLVAAFKASGSMLAKAVLANLLARDPEQQALVRDFIKEHAADRDDILRFYALNAYASLALFDAAASTELVDLYVSLDRDARNLHPAVFDAVTKSADGRAEAILCDTLADEEATPVHRVIAAQALAQKGDVAPVVAALEATAEPELVQSLATIVAASPGGVETLRRISTGETNPEKKTLLDQSIEVWSKVGP